MVTIGHFYFGLTSSVNSLDRLTFFVMICSMSEQMNNHKKDILSHENILHILRELEQNPSITQRDLSQKLKVSLGKINYFLNALIDKGIIEAKNFKNSKNKLGYMYMLTPEGVRIKLRLIQQFYEWKTREYERLKEELEFYKSMLIASQSVEPAVMVEPSLLKEMSA